MAVCFVFSFKLLVILVVFTRFHRQHVCYFELENGFNKHSRSFNPVFIAEVGSYTVKSNANLFAIPPVLLWARPPGCTPYQPSSQFSVNTSLVATLLLLSGDIELNPGPSAVNSLNFAVVNARSAVQKAAVIHSVIEELQLDCLALTETWIKSSHPDTIKRDLAPPEFTVFHTHRPNDKVGGGVAFIVREELGASQFTFSALYPSCEILAVQLPTSSGRLNIITLYQPSTRSTAFYSELPDLLDEIDSLHGKTIICGDFNCPSLLCQGILDQHLTDILAGHNLQQHVSEPTHRYGGLLDLMITPVNSSVLKSAPSIQDLGVSDHSVVNAVLNVSITRPALVKYQYRKFQDIDINQFMSKLQTSSIWLRPKATTNEYAVQLRDDVTAVLDELAPLKHVTKRRSQHTNSWLSKIAIAARRNRRQLERRYRRTKSDQDRIKYRSACHTTNRLITRSRREYINKKLTESGGDARKRWRIAQKLLHNHDRDNSLDATDSQSMEIWSVNKYISSYIISYIISYRIKNCAVCFPTSLSIN